METVQLDFDARKFTQGLERAVAAMDKLHDILVPPVLWIQNCGLFHLCDYDTRRGVYVARCDDEIAHRPGEWYAASETMPGQGVCGKCRELAEREAK